MAPTRVLEMLWIQQISVAGSSPGGILLQCCIWWIWARGPLGAAFHNAWKCRFILCALPHEAFINTCIHCHWKLHRQCCRSLQALQEGKKTGEGCFLFSSLLIPSFLLHFSSPPLSPLPSFPTFTLFPFFSYLIQEWKKKDLPKDTCVCVHVCSCVLAQAHPVVFSPTTLDKKCNFFLLSISVLVLLCVDYAARKVCEMTELIQRLLLSPELN